MVGEHADSTKKDTWMTSGFKPLHQCATIMDFYMKEMRGVLNVFFLMKNLLYIKMICQQTLSTVDMYVFTVGLYHSFGFLQTNSDPKFRATFLVLLLLRGDYLVQYIPLHCNPPQSGRMQKVYDKADTGIFKRFCGQTLLRFPNIRIFQVMCKIMVLIT